MVGGTLTRGSVLFVGSVVDSSIFGLVRGVGDFAVVLPTFVLVSRIQLTQQYHDNDHFISVASSSRHEAMVDGALSRGSALCVDLGVSRTTIVSGS
jgi:hypothetical protein